MTQYTEMSLPVQLQKALGKLNFNEPTKIQAAVIPIATEGRDLIACAETGSGKTAAYGIPMISRLLDFPDSNALILAPTRELVHQISDFFRELTAFTPGMNVTSIVGGADMRKQLNALKRQPRVIVATPGRLIDHLKRRSIQLQTTNVLVLDEGDRMIDMGFAPQLEEILKYLPKERQTSLFTATMTDKVRKLAQKYLQNPQNITIGTASQPVSAIKQSVIQLTGKQKNERILDELNARQGSVIVFTKTKRRTDSLAKHLGQYGFAVDFIHGDRSQGQRNRAIQNFRQGKSRILCATDIASRGIDIPQVELVINFDLPMMDEDYVHRIGRTARNGATGEAVSFVTPEESRTWQVLVRKYRIQGADLVRWAPQDRGATEDGEARGGRGAGRGGRRTEGGRGAEGGRGRRTEGGRGRPAGRSAEGGGGRSEGRGGRSFAKRDSAYGEESRDGRRSEGRGGRSFAKRDSAYGEESRDGRRPEGRSFKKRDDSRGFAKRDDRRNEEGSEFRGGRSFAKRADRQSEDSREFRGRGARTRDDFRSEGRRSEGGAGKRVFKKRDSAYGEESRDGRRSEGRSFKSRDDRRSEEGSEFRAARKNDEFRSSRRDDDSRVSRRDDDSRVSRRDDEFRSERKTKAFGPKKKTSARKTEGRSFGKTVKNAFAKFSRSESSART